MTLRSSVVINDSAEPVTVILQRGSTISAYDASEVGGSASVGLAVQLTGTGVGDNFGVVGLTAALSPLLGLLLSVSEDDTCLVQISGECSLPFSASAGTITPGVRLCGGAAGTVRPAIVGATLRLGRGRVVGPVSAGNNGEVIL